MILLCNETEALHRILHVSRGLSNLFELCLNCLFINLFWTISRTSCTLKLKTEFNAHFNPLPYGHLDFLGYSVCGKQDIHHMVSHWGRLWHFFGYLRNNDVTQKGNVYAKSSFVSYAKGPKGSDLALCGQWVFNIRQPREKKNKS